MKTQTLFVSFERMSRIDGAEIVTKVALVCNDLAVANSSLGKTASGGPKILSHVRRGARLYFARVISGHLHEGLKAIDQVKSSRQLMRTVDRCSSDAQAAFEALCRCRSGGKDYAQYEKYVGKIRHKIGFHYAPGLIQDAIKDRAEKATGKQSTLTAGLDIHSCRFEFGDDLLDTIVCRLLWEIPRGVDLGVEADRIGDWCNTKAIEYLRFGSDFVPRFLREHSIVI